MTSCLVDIIAGARPNFMKIAPIIRAIKEQQNAGGSIRYRLVHTGQHYDPLMSDDFFTQLDKNQIIGCFIPVTYKETVLSFISSRDESVEYIGAANWFKVVEGNIQGFNTDHLGFIN